MSWLFPGGGGGASEGKSACKVYLAADAPSVAGMQGHARTHWICSNNCNNSINSRNGNNSFPKQVIEVFKQAMRLAST